MKCHIISLTFYCVFPSDIVNFSLFLIQKSHQLILFILFFNSLQTRSLVLVVCEEHGLTFLKINYHLTCPVPDSLFWVVTTRFANNSKIKSRQVTKIHYYETAFRLFIQIYEQYIADYRNLINFEILIKIFFPQSKQV